MSPNIPNKERQAVVIIHGIGEQEPMETLREFAETIIPDIDPASDPMGVKQKFYVKPDEMAELFDLRRITVPQNATTGSIKTDFYEYYWAHQIRDTQVSDVLSWGAGIFLRWRFVPHRLKILHTVLLLLLLLIPATVITLLVLFPIQSQKWMSSWAALMAAGAGTVYLLLKGIGLLAKSVSINFIGDAARYLTPKPGNIINRQQIRKEGLELLRRLHGNEKMQSYKKIIIVAHSLGSVIAYDLVSTLWSNYHNRFTAFSQPHQDKLKQMQEKVIEISKKDKLTEQELASFKTMQAELLEASAAAGNPWRITNFITIGSPLSHAQLLLAKGKEGLEAIQKERLFPTCPPVLEAQETISFSETFNFGDTPTSLNVPHHAALFALTQWTNIWFTNDFVGGPMQQSFGKGIKDIQLVSKTHNKIPFLSHVFYWDKRETESVEIIRKLIF